MSDSEERPADESQRCPVCDYLIQPGDRVCRLCGTPLPDEMAPVPAEEAAAPQPETPARIDDQPVESADREETTPAEPTLREAEPAGAPAADVEEAEVATPASSSEEVLAAAGDAQRSPPAEVEREEEPAPATAAGPEPLPEVVSSVMHERRAPVTTIMAVVAFVVTVALGAIVLQASANTDMVVQLFPSPTPLPPTPTFTPTMTAPPTETPRPTETPTITPTPRPTDTPQPPRFHSVQPNQSWFTLAILYGISAESIAAANNRQPGSFLQVDEQVVIPWPTATPPLVPVTVELDGETYVADPGTCQTLYEIQPNDSLVSIGSQFGVDFRAILAVNRLSADAFIQPGDVVCIPTVTFFDGDLPPTPGATPTPGPTQPPAGPQLLYPPNDRLIARSNEPVVLQWVAVKDLEPDEWYMVELVDLTDISAYPRRGFTRDNVFTVPESWRPPVNEPHRFRWQVSVVRVTGQRADGTFIRTFGGRASEEGTFIWQGAVPTRTPTPTPTMTPTREP